MKSSTEQQEQHHPLQRQRLNNNKNLAYDNCWKMLTSVLILLLRTCQTQRVVQKTIVGPPVQIQFNPQTVVLYNFLGSARLVYHQSDDSDVLSLGSHSDGKSSDDRKRPCWRILHTRDRQDLIYIDVCQKKLKGWLSFNSVLYKIQSHHHDPLNQSSREPRIWGRNSSGRRLSVSLKRLSSSEIDSLRRPISSSTGESAERQSRRRTKRDAFSFSSANQFRRQIECRSSSMDTITVPIKVYADRYFYRAFHRRKTGDRKAKGWKKLRTYLESSLAQAQELFRHATLRPKIRLKLVADYHVWDQHRHPLPYRPITWRDYYQTFCSNFGTADHHSVFLTGYSNFNSNEVGLSEISGMCSPEKSCSIIRVDNAKSTLTGLTIAHEIGHNLGLQHDSFDGCKSHRYIMSIARVPHIGWSTCSVKRLQNTIGCFGCLKTNVDTNAKGCFDQDARCELFARRGDCLQPKFRSFLADNCPQACRFCSINKNTPRTRKTSVGKYTVVNNGISKTRSSNNNNNRRSRSRSSNNRRRRKERVRTTTSTSTITPKTSTTKIPQTTATTKLPRRKSLGRSNSGTNKSSLWRRKSINTSNSDNNAGTKGRYCADRNGQQFCSYWIGKRRNFCSRSIRFSFKCRKSCNKC